MLLDAWRLSPGTLGAVPVAPPAPVDRRRAGGAMVLVPLAAVAFGFPVVVVVVVVAGAVRRFGGATGAVFGAAVRMALAALLFGLS